MKIDVLIDKLTPCLQRIETGELLQTVFSVTRTEELIGLPKKGWNFDWHSVSLDPKINVYKLLIQGDDTVQGLIATEVKKNAV